MYSYHRTAEVSPGANLQNMVHTLQAAAREMGKIRYSLQGMEAQLALKARSTRDHAVSRDLATLKRLNERYHNIQGLLESLIKDMGQAGRGMQ